MNAPFIFRAAVTQRVFALVSLVSLASIALTALPAHAESSAPAATAPPSAEIDGTVVDAGTGLPIAGASIAVADHDEYAHADRSGAFRLSDLPPGVYRLDVSLPGYQPAESNDLALVGGERTSVTLSLVRSAAEHPLAVIGATATSAASSLQRSSTISTSLSADALSESGVTRAGDALRELPGIDNSITGDTASLGDDIPLQLRGLGALESTTALDGHPIALGFPGGYNFQLSPIAALSDIVVTYGSGSNLLGTSAIGGVINMETLNPTAQQHVTVDQGWGTFDKTMTTLQATGTSGRIGYAFAYGAAGLDGPIKHTSIYQPGAAFDQSAPVGSPVYDLGTYDDDASTDSHSGLLKLRYETDPGSSLTFTSMLSSYYENKTANGDGDYLAYGPAFEKGEQLLANYKPPANATAMNPACPSGTFLGTNANGQPNGFGPDGQPDGGISCQTPQQYAAFNTGYQGAGPAWQTFDFSDQHLAYERTRANGTFRADVFTDRYDDIASRQDALPFLTAPGDSPQATLKDQLENEAGASVSYDLAGRANAVGLGVSYLNLAYDLQTSTPGNAPAGGAPIVHQTDVMLRDVYHAPGSPLTVYANAVLDHATATNTTSLDPRASVVYNVSRRDVVRVSAGATTTQPSGNMLGQSFVAKPLGGAGGGAAIACGAGAINAIGSAPSSVLHPERGVDQEVAYGHSFGGDSQLQVDAYSINIYDKLYSTVVPLSTTGTSFIDPTFLTQEINAGATCGGAQLGLTGTFNVGALRGRGVTVSGRQRIDRRTFVDYDWVTDSTVITSAPVNLLQANLTLVPGAQLPHLPLHTLDTSVDRLLGRAIDLRYTFHWVSSNNTKGLPAYSYSALRLSSPLKNGTLSIGVDNLFNQNAFVEGYLYEGVPLALNQYAPASAYGPLGAAATEQFGLPSRRVFMSYA
ncbi:MAG TPA: TonB-dependent receptor, partial [Candidatus Limnocylindria bacterium]|nr:TonB-dependent receptor [Candidatus Limnocylindria bacterium]